MKTRFFINTVASLHIILFVYTGIMKIIDHERFYIALHKNSMFEYLAGPLSYTIPPIELALAALLMTPKYRMKGILGSFILMTIFTIYIFFMLELKSDRPCTCGGILVQMNWHQHLYFDSTFAALSLIALRLNRKQLQSATPKGSLV